MANDGADMSVSEVTHLICAHCGYDNSVSNAEELKPVGNKPPVLYYLVFTHGPTAESNLKQVALFFHCQECDADYKLPMWRRM
jgi:hypothetical protein